MGIRPSQQNSTRSLNRTRGRLARSQIKTKINTQVLRPSTKDSILINVLLAIISGPQSYPPKKRIAVRELIRTMLPYSAKKNITKIIELCSVKNPATSSDSPSTRSNGVRLTSATAEIQKIRSRGKRGITNHTAD